ncbi:MAG: hypothetical protein ACM3O8_11160 [Methylococcaceae bacterium]|nr:hypothetical protein [Prolixibacteraceae bacterium]
METIQQNNPDLNLEKLVSGLQHEDARNLRLTSNFMWIMWIMAPLYLIFAIVGFTGEEFSTQHIGFIFFSLGFLVFGFLFWTLRMEYKSVDYGIPTIEMLQKAVKRYKFWQAKTYLTIIPVILVCFATSFSIEHLLPYPDQIKRMVIVFVIYLLVLCVAFFIGYLVWRTRQKPLRDKALAMLAEIEG